MLHVLPEAEPLFVNIFHDILHGVVGIDLALGGDAQRHLALFGGQVSATYAVDQPVVDDRAVAVQRLEEHAVGVERLDDIGMPDYLHILRGQAAGDSHIGVVSAAGGC